MADAQTKDAHAGDGFEFTDMAVGEVLRRTRMHYGRSLEDVERDIRIRAHLIEAIEENHTDVLPARVYAIGFVRSYSEYLGLDGSRMVELFKNQAGEKAKEPEVFMPVADSDHRAPPGWLVAGSIVFLLIMAGVWTNDWSKSRQDIEAIPEVPAEIQDSAFAAPENERTESGSVVAEPVEVEVQVEEAAETPAAEIVASTTANEESSQDQAEEAAKQQPAAAPAPQTAVEEAGIILNIRDNSWVEIRDRAGTRLISRVLKAGDQYYVPDRPDLTMSLGNAGGVEIEVDGKVLSPLGRDAQVRRNIPLDAKYLKNTYASQQ